MRTRLVALAVLVAFALSGCGGSSKGSTDDSAQLAAHLAAAKKSLDAAETVSIDLSTSHLPTGVTGLLSAKGHGNHTPAFSGDVKVVTGGASLSAKIIAVGGKTYAKTGFSPTYLTIDPASLKAPDPASLIKADGGISTILTSTQRLTDGGKSRDGSQVLTSIHGVLQGNVVQGIIPSADPTKKFTVVYRLTDKNVLHDVTLTGPFYATGGSVTYTVAVSTSSTPVTITAP